MEAEQPDILARQRAKRMDNLTWANKVRTAQAVMKKRLRAGELDPIAVLEGRDETWSRFAREVKIGVLLEAVPRLGRSTVHEILLECRLFPEDRLKNADEEQVDRLIELVKMLLDRE